MSQVKSWSYSRWHTFEQCPFKFAGEVIDGHREPQSEAMARGDRMHKELEAYIMQPPGGELQVPLSAMTFFADFAQAIRALPRKMAEFQITYRRNWTPTGWMSKDAWWRSKLDVFGLYSDGTADIVDWKSGRQYPEHKDQLEGYGLAGLLWSRALKSVRTRMSYLDSGEELVYEFTQDDVPALKDKWAGRAAQMLEATEFPATPNALCGFCWRRQSGGDGSCKFG